MDKLLRISVLMQMIANPMEKFWAGFRLPRFYPMPLFESGMTSSVPLIPGQKKNAAGRNPPRT
jgi:hypothetical protein